MAMVNLKMSKAERKTEMMPVELEGPEYPWGLTVDLNDETLAKLGMSDLPKVGTEIIFRAKSVVKSASESEYEGKGKRQSVSLQITDMEIGESMTERTNSAASKLYGA